MSSLAKSIYEHRITWGISIFALWAFILALVAAANVLLLSKVAELYGYETEIQGRVWLIFILNTLFGLGFAASAYGLWQRRNWGRLLFLWIIVIWSFSNVVALFMPDSPFSSNMRPTISNKVLESIRFSIGPVASLWYLNLARVKCLFSSTDRTDNFIDEEVNHL